MAVGCSTCMESFKSSCDISMIPCGHTFHTRCIKDWIRRGHSDCPQCRKSWHNVQLKKIFLSTTSNDVEQELLQVNLKRIELVEELEIILDEAKKQEADFATERKQWWNKNEVLNNWIEYLKWICKNVEKPEFHNIEKIPDVSNEIIQWSPLHEAAYFGHTEIFTDMIRGVKENDAALFEKHTFQTPFHCAIERGHQDICKIIIEELKDSMDESYLHFAIEHGQSQIFKMILNEVENKNLPNSNLVTPLHLAAKKGQKDICRIILDAIDDKSPKDCNGNTPLFEAIRSGNVEIFEMIFNEVKEKNPKNNEGLTVLHLAAGNGQNEILR